ncbi:hypothetical protein K493DRAFT_342034 [Basidiobolus meristosporus CBS 931.73]|uniref:Nucleic acid-binding protein n=1 Tax=Basidiobolus meristosporus CBS 931.73 TaxID=1314790 RepID=A0A1Y1XD83_9FUNG|nr:hypothetical protein K493DRAFT_342034 [Basidiobolus meristosporus CBS 931.73]|eukprot:ORX83396.1 hypothetical protein K493DRAFT_342034 [Basidiobolus meristosporus CBS 931.73]
MDFEKLVDRYRDKLNNQLKRKTAQQPQKNHVDVVPWNWVAGKITSLLSEYPSGLTDAIICSELEVQWEESSIEYKRGVSKKFGTIDSMLESAMSEENVFEVEIKTVRILPGTRTCVITLSDQRSPHHLDMYLHQKYYFLTTDDYKGLFNQNQRQIRITGIRLLENASRFPRLLPTEMMIFMLSSENSYDQRFIKEELEVDKLGDVSGAAIAQGKEYRFWVKIVHIGSEQAGNIPGRLKKLKIFVNDMSTNENAVFLLWDEQIAMRDLFKKGDYLGLHRPYINGDSTYSDDMLILEYGTGTVLFCLPSDFSQEVVSSSMPSQTGSSQTTVPRDDFGLLDYKYYPERIYIHDLKPKMINITLFGRIVAMSQNIPVEKTGTMMDRFAVRVLDITGTCDITLWEAIGHDAAPFRIGQYILLEGLSTSERKENGQCFVNGSEILGCQVRNISTLKGILASPALREMVPLKNAVEYDNFYCRSVIVGWEAGNSKGISSKEGIPNLILLTHNACKRTVIEKSDWFYCEHCKVEIRDDSGLEPIYNITWFLDDGTDALSVQGLWNASLDILGLPAQEFMFTPKEEAELILQRAIGKEIWALICQVNLQEYELSVALPPCCPIGEVMELLNSQ